jgi:hypothetical protein
MTVRTNLAARSARSPIEPTVECTGVPFQPGTVGM